MKLIAGQLEFYWDVHLRPRLDGLTDDEYLWEPVADCFSVRPGADGLWVMDSSWPGPAPDPAPVTTIAWRMMHIAATGFHNRASAFFGEDPWPDAGMNDWVRMPKDLPGTAAGAVRFLEQAYEAWMTGFAALDDDAAARPLGRKGGEYADDTLAGLGIHINREVMHHGGEICLLRDLYLRR